VGKPERDLLGTGCNDSAWVVTALPRQWQATPELSGHRGSVVYRKRFNIDEHDGAGLKLLHFQGAFGHSVVWLNDERLGEHETYYAPFTFDITKRAKPGENVLAVAVDAIDREGLPVDDPSFCPGGLWGSVSLTAGSDMAILRLNPHSQVTAWQAAQMELSIRVRDISEGDAVVKVQIVPENFNGKSQLNEFAVKLANGNNDLTFNLVIPEPRIWWTWDLGYPHVYRIKVSLERNGVEQDRRECLHCFRTLEFDNGNGMRLNQIPTYLRGFNCLPPRRFWVDIRGEEWRNLASLVRKENGNCLRAYGFMAPSAVYERCARDGVLVMQDIPGLGLQASGNMDLARHVRDMTVSMNGVPGPAAWVLRTSGTPRAQLAAIESLLMDRDPDTPLVHVRHEGPKCVSPSSYRGLEFMLSRLPGSARFVWELGAVEGARGDERGCGIEGMKLFVQTLRQHRLKPSFGYLYYGVNAPGPNRLTEGELAAAAQWNAPVQCFATPSKHDVVAGGEFRTSLWVANDTRKNIPATAVRWSFDGPNGDPLERGAIVADLPAESVTSVGDLSVKIPEAPHDTTYKLSLELWLPTKEKMHNSYDISAFV
jgi:hypothetical protein